MGQTATNLYFAGRLVYRMKNGVTTAVQDRLGSMGSYYPYGEEYTTTQQDQQKFATYYRDTTTVLDYARNRYYSSTLGRFMTADPYKASGGPADPGSWNRYAYVGNDPVNWFDPWGLQQNPPGEGGPPAPPILLPIGNPVPAPPQRGVPADPLKPRKKIFGAPIVRSLLEKKRCAEDVGADPATVLSDWDNTEVDFSPIGKIRAYPLGGNRYNVLFRMGEAEVGSDRIDINSSQGINWLDPSNSTGYVVGLDGFTLTSQTVSVNLLQSMANQSNLPSISAQDFRSAVLLHEFAHAEGLEEGEIDMKAIFKDCLGIEQKK